MSIENGFIDETLDACKALKSAGSRVTRKTLAVKLKITREAASYRLSRLYELELWPRNPISTRPVQIGLADAEVAARIRAIRAAIRERDRPLFSEELNQVLGDEPCPSR